MADDVPNVGAAGPVAGAAGRAADVPIVGPVGDAAACRGEGATGAAAADAPVVGEDLASGGGCGSLDEATALGVAGPLEGAAGIGVTEPARDDTGVRTAGPGELATGVAPDILVLAPAEGPACVCAGWPLKYAVGGPGDAETGGAPAMTVAAAIARQTDLRMRVSREEMGQVGSRSRIGHFGWMRPLRGLR